MQTRRDQLQAYQFLVRRILAALLGNEPEAPEQPMRRAKAATFSGIMIGALACGAVALTGFLTHSSSQGWQDDVPGLIVDKGTNGLLYYKEVGGRKTLFPIINYPSAQLLLGEAAPNPKPVPSENLAGVDRGPQVGIPDIPESLPGSDSVTDGPWLVCNHLPAANERKVDLFVDQQPPKDSTALGERAVVVNDDAGQRYLVWHGTRFAVGERALLSLAMNPEFSIRVAPAWLNLLPQGEDLTPRPPDGLGGTGVEVDGEPTVVGQVFVVPANGTYWVMYPDGLVSTTETHARLLLGSVAEDPTGVQQEAIETGVRSATDARSPSTAEMPLPESQPDDLPKPAEPSEQAAVCLTYEGDPDAGLKVSVGGEVPRANTLQAAGGRATGPTADRVTITGGEAAVIGTLGANDEPSGWAVVADTGLKYPVPDKSVLGTLGYEGVSPMLLPKALADLIQAGPELDPKAAGLAAAQ